MMEKRKIIRSGKQFGIGTLAAVAFVVALTAFVVGTRANDILAQWPGNQHKDLASNLDFTSVQAVYDKLRQSYDGKLDADKLVDGVKKGLVEATGDPYTVYFTDAEAKEFMSDLEGTFSGIGAELDKREGKLLIASTLDDSPARKAGLSALDVIAKVNDQETSMWSVDKAVSQIRGEKGTSVKLSIVRNGQLKEFTIVRDNIVAPSVKWEINSDNIGYLRISRFAQDNTKDLARRAAQEFKDKSVKGVVLDLRGNGGGYLQAAKDISSLWLDKKLVVEERQGDKTTDRLYAGNDPVLAGIPTTVLVDGGSASASEIVAGALHDNGAAKLIGVKTFGKGSVQQIIDVPGGQLKVTIAKWYTPNGKNISKEGIAPDIEIKLTDDDIKNGRDPQKDKAFELVKK